MFFITCSSSFSNQFSSHNKAGWHNNLDFCPDFSINTTRLVSEHAKGHHKPMFVLIQLATINRYFVTPCSYWPMVAIFKLAPNWVILTVPKEIVNLRWYFIFGCIMWVSVCIWYCLYMSLFFFLVKHLWIVPLLSSTDTHITFLLSQFLQEGCLPFVKHTSKPLHIALLLSSSFKVLYEFYINRGLLKNLNTEYMFLLSGNFLSLSVQL